MLFAIIAGKLARLGVMCYRVACVESPGIARDFRALLGALRAWRDAWVRDDDVVMGVGGEYVPGYCPLERGPQRRERPEGRSPAPPAAELDERLFYDSDDLPEPTVYEDRPPPKRGANSAAYKALRARMLRTFAAERRVCARCGKPINYQLRDGPWCAEMGHNQSVAERPDLEYAEWNTQPEHQRCNRQGTKRTQGPPGYRDV